MFYQGVFLTPKLKNLTQNVERCTLIKPVKYSNNLYVNVVLQCRVRKQAIRIPECSQSEYYIINNPRDIRPYGILVNFITAQEASIILKNTNFNFASIEEIISNS